MSRVNLAVESFRVVEGFLNSLYDQPAIVAPARWADVVRQFQFSAYRAFTAVGRGDCIVRPSLVPPGRRYLVLLHSHDWAPNAPALP